MSGAPAVPDTHKLLSGFVVFCSSVAPGGYELSDCRCGYNKGLLFVPVPAMFIALVALIEAAPALSAFVYVVVPTWMLIWVPKYVKLIISSMFSKHFD